MGKNINRCESLPSELKELEIMAESLGMEKQVHEIAFQLNEMLRGMTFISMQRVQAPWPEGTEFEIVVEGKEKDK